jgi:tRNA 2-thiouridine synthesizing protein A
MSDARPSAAMTLDAGETACGELIMRIAAEMKRFVPGQVLHVVAYDPGAREDIPAWCRMTHNPLLHTDTSADTPAKRGEPTHFFIQKGA